MKPTEINIDIDIDISSKQLNIYVKPTGQFFSVANDKNYIKGAIKQRQPLKPQRALIEPIGGLEIEFFVPQTKQDYL
ncbi:hypothetical protein ACJJIW_00145 [Microbulbifer sp. JMSA004]|uniref:hypothetical protein n=1 Tax=Microbulbifer sp. JMSA004 TaxID=3243370 RepID=UPI00403A43A4